MNTFKSSRTGSKAGPEKTHAAYSLPALQDEDGADIGQILQGIWRRKMLIVLCAILSAGVFFGLTATQPNMYTARTTLILDSREQQVIASQDQIVGDLQINNPIIEGEVAILKSRPILERVVMEMGIGRFDGLDPALRPPGAIARVKTYAKSSLKNAIALVTGPSAEAPAVQPIITPEQRRLNRVMGVLREGTSVYRVGSSYVIEIKVTTNDPVLSAETSNRLAQAYIDTKISDRQSVVESATRWLSGEVEVRRLRLADTEEQVEKFKSDQLAFSGTTREMIELQLPELSRQRAMASADLSAAKAQLEQVRSVLQTSGHVVVSQTFPTPFLTSIRIERETLVREDARLASTLGAAHTDRQVIAAEINQIDSVIEKEVDNMVQSLQNEISILSIRQASLEGDVAELEAKLSDISKHSSQLGQLEADAEVARENYETLLGRLGETRAQSEIQRSEAQIISLAQVPGGPSSPRTLLFTAFGTVLGLTCGLFAALMLELTRSVFKRASEVERLTNLPVLSVLPKHHLPKPQNILKVVDNKKYSLISERLRALRTVLTMSAPDAGPQSILLLSSVSHEGKTTTAMGLANFYARAGSRVILVDLDTRRSSVAALIKGQPKFDLSDYLNGDAELAEAIVKAPDLGFDLATTTRSKAYMADRLNSDGVAKLIAELKKSYDAVIIDAPPLLAVSDGLRIASAVDQILYVIRWRSTRRASVQYGLAALQSVDLSPTGVVLTMAESSADPGGYSESYEYT
ncbi:MAG: polysaccharide biosynthesis tyrosine autokinase [Sulfitobacter sp.]